MPIFQRYVAIGDSTTEGLDDPRPDGGYRGWADRLAERLSELNPALTYANLAVRGRLAGQVRDTQLEPALAMEPDLATVVAGLNDVLRPRCDLDAVAADLAAMQRAFIATGATVVTFTMPDPSAFNPIARLARTRLREYNESMRAVAGETGALLLDLGASAAAGDPRLWSDDRLHANAAGHARVAAGLAHALGLPGADPGWADPLPAPARRTRRDALAGELQWSRLHLAPWLMRRVRGRSSGDGVVAKRPLPQPLGPQPTTTDQGA